jgi:hypothetical protein
MRITDALGVRRRYAPVVDSLLAISLDLGIDAIATRMGLWTWVDIGPTDGWFGVPWGNFYSWLFVTAGFSLVTRWLRRAAYRRPSLEWLQLLVPVPAFALLLIGLMPFIFVKPLVDSSRGGGGILFLITLLVFLGIAGWAVFGRDRGSPDGANVAILDLRLATVTRLAIHGSFLVGLLMLGLASQLPILLLVIVALLLAELPLAGMVRARHREAGARAHREGSPDIAAKAPPREVKPSPS